MFQDPHSKGIRLYTMQSGLPALSSPVDLLYAFQDMLPIIERFFLLPDYLVVFMTLSRDDEAVFTVHG